MPPSSTFMPAKTKSWPTDGRTVMSAGPRVTTPSRASWISTVPTSAPTIEPTRARYIMLKSRIHYRAGFKPIASHILECQREGVTNADLSVYRYEKLKRPIHPLDPL